MGLTVALGATGCLGRHLLAVVKACLRHSRVNSGNFDAKRWETSEKFGGLGETFFQGKLGIKIRLDRMELQPDVQQGEVCCPLEWGKIGHQEFQGLLRSLLVSQTWFGDVWRNLDLFP